LIRRTPNVSRGIELTETRLPAAECEIPLLGVIAAGRPIEAILSQETICVPHDMLGRDHTFALRVRGDSMSGEGMLDGDFIVVESRQTAESGQTVVALINGSDVTVKTFVQERGRAVLKVANPRKLLIKHTVTKDVDEYRAETRIAIAMRKLKSAGVRVHPGERVNYLLSDVRNKDKSSQIVIEDAVEGSRYDASEYIKLLQAAADEVLFAKPTLLSVRSLLLYGPRAYAINT
jgi:repressor LexA